MSNKQNKRMRLNAVRRHKLLQDMTSAVDERSGAKLSTKVFKKGKANRWLKLKWVNKMLIPTGKAGYFRGWLVA